MCRVVARSVSSTGLTTRMCSSVRVDNLVPRAVWNERYEQINEFERLLSMSGTHIVIKIFLHISKDEQRQALRVAA